MCLWFGRVVFVSLFSGTFKRFVFVVVLVGIFLSLSMGNGAKE